MSGIGVAPWAQTDGTGSSVAAQAAAEKAIRNAEDFAFRVDIIAEDSLS
jgi:hypothetical protein